jgi:hypothetical protein
MAIIIAAAHATLLKNRFIPYKKNNLVIFDIKDIGKELAYEMTVI